MVKTPWKFCFQCIGNNKCNIKIKKNPGESRDITLKSGE